MFTQKCFIRKNTPEIRKRLDEIGRAFIENGHGEWRIHVDNNEYLFCGDEQFCDNRIYYYIGRVCKPIEGIDCGTNEELFLAIAALRDDSDIDNNQVFIHQDGNFYKCECDSKIDMWGDFEESESYPRKATVSELIELFNK